MGGRGEKTSGRSGKKGRGSGPPRAIRAPTSERVRGPKPFALAEHAVVVAAPAQTPGLAQHSPPSDPPLARTDQPTTAEAPPAPAGERLAANAAEILATGRRIAAAWAKGAEAKQGPGLAADSIADAAGLLGRAAEAWMARPQDFARAQSEWAGRMIDLWSNTLQRFTGQTDAPLIPREASDKRFAGAQWDQPFFDFLRQAHKISADWTLDLVQDADTLDARERMKALFFVRQMASAASPSNFLLTNPALLDATLKSGGDNLVRGLRMLAEDIEAGGGQLRLRQSDPAKLELGRDMAATPGKVVFRNDMIELIQYAPATDEVFARPVLVVPPWINKFYILDLNPAKSFVGWMVEQGLTVFMISWVNPEARHADKGLADYMREGVLAAVDAIEKATGSRDISAIGYCVGGTMLAMTLAWMAAKGEARISSATFFAAQTDFSEPGELAVFADEATVASIEKHMAETGTLDGAVMANAFNMLRPDDLIWSYFVGNYLSGKEPAAFDLLSWNSDATRMTRACHSAYLRECYVENNLAKGRMTLEGETLDLGAIAIPVYSLATREDHIAPARSVYRGMQRFGGSVRYVLGGSGHIAGVVNPPALGKYQFWAGGPFDESFEAWRAGAQETKGSWWPDWFAWIAAQAPAKQAARQPGEGALPPLGDAPGEYVRVKA